MQQKMRQRAPDSISKEMQATSGKDRRKSTSMAVSITSLITRITMNMPKSPAVAESKVTNPFQIREAMFSAIFCSEASSQIIDYIETVPLWMVCPDILLAMVLSKASFSAGNIIRSLNFSISFSE